MNDIMSRDPKPEGWNLVQLRQVFRERKEKGSDSEFPPLSVTMQGILPQLDTAAKTDRGDDRKIVRIGDYVINSRSDRKGSGGISALEGSVSLISIVMEPVGITAQFAHHLLRSVAFQEEFYRFGHGIVDDLWTTRFDELKRIQVYLPCTSKQIEIASCLNRETTRIDTLIKKKTRFIELLKEKRQAFITQAVTKGLDPNTKMKDSGVEWLGEVPAHWTATKCGRFLSILSGYAFPSSGFDLYGNGTRLLRGVNVGVGELRWDQVVYWKRTLGDGLEDFEMRVGDLVIGMDRPQIANGTRIAHVTETDLPCLLLQRVASLRTMPTLSSEFFFYCLSTPFFSAHFSPDATGISVPHISPEQIASFVIAIPSSEEQRHIVDHIDAATTKIDTLLNKTERSIELLKEKRSALLAAAVTGKIDLREAA